MARRKSPTLIEVELELMDALGQRAGDGFRNRRIAARLATGDSSVLTMMRILEQKRYVEHEKEGRALSTARWSTASRRKRA